MSKRLVLAGMMIAMAQWLGACREIPRDPLELERGQLTVHNRTDEEWRDVEIWLNRQFRVTRPVIAPDEEFRVHVNSFTAGFGQRFDFNRMLVKDLRLTAKRPNGESLELVKEFQKGGLEGALGGKF
jgi:hypothetical protein